MTSQGYPADPSGARAGGPRLIHAVLDANVLYPAFLRDVLLRLAASDLFRPYWTARIHDEWLRNVIRDRPDLEPEALVRVRKKMDAHFFGALLQGSEDLEGEFGGVHPGDRHVGAAALKARADRIITQNLKHFPAYALQPHGIVAQHPDDFICELIQTDPVTALAVLRAHRAGLQRPPHDHTEYARAFTRAGLVNAAGLLLAATP